MARRRRPSLAGAAAALAAGAVALGLATAVPATTQADGPLAARTVVGPDSRPNILLITSDDQRDDEMRWMPFTRRLIAHRGVDVTDFISPHPMCCPARAEILTGEYAQNNGVRHNSGPYGGWQAFVANGDLDHQLGSWLQAAGYHTGFVGKTLNGYPSNPVPMPGFDHWNPSTKGTYAYYGTTFYADGVPVRYPDEHVSDVVAGYTHDYLREFAAEDAPWFLWVSHVGPHTATTGHGHTAPPIPAERHEGLFKREVPPSLSATSLNEEDLSDKPMIVARHRPRDLRQVTHLFRQRIRTLQSIDEANRAAIRQLGRLGELDNTIVVYTSDNGFLLGEHRLEGKNYPYEEALQVPFEIRGPGVPQGVEVDQRLSTVDLAPTFLAAAGVLDLVRAGGHTDGQDLMPVLRGEARAPGTQLIQAGTDRTRPLAHFGWWWRGVTTGRWTYARWFTGREELYDRRRDPAELDNLADRASYRNVLAELRRRYDVLSTCAGPAECTRDLGPQPHP